MTLLSGGFDAMPQILLEGRRVINNITRAASLFLVKNLYSMLLSLALLFLPFAYPFAPIQLTLISTLTIGAPSFILALQPSREKTKGRFLENILLRALPGGICTAALLLAALCLREPLGLAAAQESTLCTVAAAASGLVTLALTCLPFPVAAGLCGGADDHRNGAGNAVLPQALLPDAAGPGRMADRRRALRVRPAPAADAVRAGKAAGAYLPGGKKRPPKKHILRRPRCFPDGQPTRMDGIAFVKPLLSVHGFQI